MTIREKMMVGRAKRPQKQSSPNSSLARSKKERGRKRHCPSPPLPRPIQFSFFKVLIGDFSDMLFIPPMVACNLKDLTKKYVYVEDSDGHYWTVKISMVDGSLAFQKGWHDFVSAHSMTFGEFVIFTYYGGMLFKARIFGTCSLERVNFKLKSTSNRCSKERYISELSLDSSVRFPKNKKAHQGSEDEHQISTTKEMLRLNREEETALSDLPMFTRIEIDNISEGVAEVPRAVKPQRVCDATIEQELNNTSSSGLVKSDGGLFKSIRNSMGTTGQGAVYLNAGQTLLSTQTARKIHTNVQNAYAWPINKHSHINEVLPGKSDSQNGKMRTKVNVDENNSHNLEHNDSDDDKVTGVSNLKDANCSPKMEEIPIELKGDNLKFLLTEDGICFLVDENFTELATGPDMEMYGKEDSVCENNLVNFCSEATEQFENIPAIPSTPILGFTKDWGSQTKIERRDSVDRPSLSSIFSVRLSDDVQSSLKLPEVLAFQQGEIINQRKVVVLQDPSMNCWPVLYHESISYIGFIGGWMDFARANNICRGDVCKFKLVNKMEHIFRVLIIKA